LINSAASIGGADPEDIDELRENATRIHSAQYRNVTATDYKAYLESRSDVECAHAWGEQEIAPSGSILLYNKVHLTVVPPNNPDEWANGTINTTTDTWTPSGFETTSETVYIASSWINTYISREYDEDSPYAEKEGLEQFLEPRKLLTTYEDWSLPDLVYFSFKIGVRMQRLYNLTDVSTDILAKLIYYFRPANMDFNQTINFLDIQEYLLDTSEISPLDSYDYIKGLKTLIIRDVDCNNEIHESNVIGLQGNRQSITAIGGYWTRLWIKVVDLEGKVPDYPGFVEFKFRVNNNYLEGDNFIFDKGSMLTVAASANSTEFTSGSEVYFKKGTYLYEWLVKNSTTYKDFFNTNKTFCYFGKIYPHKDQTNSYHIIFDGMKNYVMNALPRENRSDNLTEFMRLYFDKIYQKIYNKMKDIPSLLDAKEIDINLIDYMSKAYLIDTDINLTETALREWTENLVYLLKRKGTYSALWIIWKTFLKNTLNVLNIYNRWHENPDLFTYDVDVPLGKFIDVLHELDYGIMPDGCAGSYWYSKVLTAISPGHIFIQNTPSTIWYISHNMFTKEIMIQCYDHAYNRIWPASVKSVSTGMVKVIFGTAVYGHAYLMRKGDFTHIQNNIDASWIITHNLGQKEVLSQYRDTDYNKIIPDEVILNTINHINTTFGTATAGSVTVRDEVLDVNLKVITNPVASTTWNMEHGFATSGVLTDDIGVFVQLFDDSDNTMIKPLSLTLIDGNNCRAVFDSAKSGYAVIKASKLSEIVLPDYNLDNMILSPHYKLEMDLSCEPIDDDVGYILKKETIDRLIKNWELMRPVSRTSYYHELISPKVDFTGQYKSLYSKGYNAYLYSKFCASAAEFLPSPSADTLYFKQYVNEEVWKINHTLDTE